MSSQPKPIIRPLQTQDRSAWGTLWAAYLKFYGTERAAEIHDLYFGRLLGQDPRDYNAMVAELNGTLIGLTHFLFHRHGWLAEDVCYLQDLFVAPEARGTGAGRALIEAVYAAADSAGAPRVYWLTQDFNREARQLYDRIGRVTPFVKYERRV